MIPNRLLVYNTSLAILANQLSSQCILSFSLILRSVFKSTKARNAFSNEVTQFLTSKPIPEHITILPAEVLETCVHERERERERERD